MARTDMVEINAGMSKIGIETINTHEIILTIQRNDKIVTSTIQMEDFFSALIEAIGTEGIELLAHMIAGDVKQYKAQLAEEMTP